jgi:hypothetical protein
MPPKQSVLVGNPRPANEILRSIYVDPADAEAVKSIPQGYAQETVLDRHRAVSLIAKMERMQLVPRGAFRVRTFREGEKRKVAIAHVGQGKEPSIKGGMPTAESVSAFIESQQDFRHDLNLIAQHFLHQVMDSRTDGSLYRGMRRIAIEARQLVEKKHGGKFTESNVGHHKYYVWSKE